MEPIRQQSMENATADTPATAQVPARRRLIKNGALGVTVVLATLASRPALAEMCKGPSAFGSLNSSRMVRLTECGGSPDYWKSKPGVQWPIPPTTPFNQTFTAGQQANPVTFSLMDAISTAGGDVIMLRRKVVAALLNNLAGMAPDFLTAAEIKAMWAAASVGLNYVNSSRGIDWTAAEVISYFDSLY